MTLSIVLLHALLLPLVGEVDERHADEDEAEAAEQGAIGPLAEEEQRAEDADGRHAEERERCSDCRQRSRGGRSRPVAEGGRDRTVVSDHPDRRRIPLPELATYEV